MMQEEYKQFITVACETGKLSPQAAVFCQERMELGETPDVVAVREKFMTEEQVAHIHSLIPQDQKEKKILKQMGGLEMEEQVAYIHSLIPQEKQESPRSICITEPQIQKSKEEEEEEKILAYIKEKNLLSEESLAFCQKERKRLAAMGYAVQLSALFCGTGNLTPSQIKEMYLAISEGNTAVALIEESVPFCENALPLLRKEKKKQSKPKEGQEKIMEQLKDMVESKAQKKKGKTGKKKAVKKTPSERDIETEIDQDLEDWEQYAKENQTLSEEKEASMAMNVNFNALVSSLQVLMQTLQQNPSGINPDVFSEALPQTNKGQQSSEDESGEKEDTSIFTKGKAILPADKAIKAIQKGSKLEGCYIKDLSLTGIKLEFPLRLLGCAIENLDLSDSEFLHEVDFEESCFLGKACFKNAVFHKEAQFKKAIFVDGADFTKSDFKGDTRFNTTSFKRFVSFNRSQFAQKAIFSRSSFAKGVKFNEVEFGGAASFNDLYCDHRYYMDNCKFLEETTFSNSHFSDIADFSQSTFQKVVKFKGTNFGKWVTFQYVKFEDECHFNGANVVGDISFGWAKFHGLINLSTLCAERNVNFKNAQIQEDARFRFLDAYFGRLFISTAQVENHLESHIEQDFKTARQEYGILKNNYREINEYEQEDWAYLWEKRMERLSIKPQGLRSSLWRFFDWLALDLACGYGTKPLHIFLTSLVVLLSFGIFYYAFGSQFVLLQEGVSTSSIPLMDAIQVSFRTFTNSSIGGWEARGTSWINYIMMLESFLGFFVMTVLVVTFSRKVIR